MIIKRGVNAYAIIILIYNARLIHLQPADLYILLICLYILEVDSYKPGLYRIPHALASKIFRFKYDVKL